MSINHAIQRHPLGCWILDAILNRPQGPLKGQHHMAHPSSYKTLQGLLRGTEHTLRKREAGIQRFDGQSIGMWLHNAQYCAETTFKAGDRIRALVAKYAITRPQDLHAPAGGHAVFGIPLPTREYSVGDNVPGTGLVADATDTQLCIGGAWYHRTCFDKAA